MGKRFARTADGHMCLVPRLVRRGSDCGCEGFEAAVGAEDGGRPE
jgi:hypothetical protein